MRPNMNRTKKILSYLTIACVFLGVFSAGAFWYWAQKRPLSLSAERVDYLIEAGSSPKRVAATLNEAGVAISELAFVWLARLTRLDRKIQAGAYEAVVGDTPKQLLDRMAKGDMLQTRVALIEGWTYQSIRQALRNHDTVKQTLPDDQDAVREELGIEGTALEGWFYPDTYVFVPGTTDYDILRRAHHAQQQVLQQAWESRSEGLPLKTPYEALILASIVEKETGHAEDRRRIAGVFMNRLKINMALQTDPTVIYGLGDRYQGRLRKVDLQTDTPWNTYTRNGLPPTPIASPSRAALEAVLHPEQHDFYYFVSRGDGTSEFSRTLAAHNRAVAKYILGRK